MAQPRETSTAETKLKLSEAERSVLLQACKDYRASLPSYLQSKQTEMRILDELIRKLAKP